MAVRQRSKHELVAALQGRYRRADRTGKARLLDEFCAATGYHRKHAIRLPGSGWSPANKSPRPGEFARYGRPRTHKGSADGPQRRRW
jgi:hypothetical protein